MTPTNPNNIRIKGPHPFGISGYVGYSFDGKHAYLAGHNDYLKKHFLYREEKEGD